jgi:hypothetical protein
MHQSESMLWKCVAWDICFFACEHSNKDFVTVSDSLINNNLSVIYSNGILQTTQNSDIVGN